MAPRQLLEKEAWEWAKTTPRTSITPAHMRTAYRLDLAACGLLICRRNCVGNPHCLNCLGDKAWWETDIEELVKDKCEPLDETLRKQDEYVGLKNLGATCYINTFLQVWYHTPVFRRAVLLWQNLANNSSVVTSVKCESSVNGSHPAQSECVGRDIVHKHTSSDGCRLKERRSASHTNIPASETKLDGVELRSGTRRSCDKSRSLTSVSNGQLHMECSSSGTAVDCQMECTSSSTDIMERMDVVGGIAESGAPKADDVEDIPQTVCRELQRVFSYMAFSRRMYINPLGLITALHLDEYQQQDAQEFSKLLLSLLESVLRPPATSSNIIQEQFVGKYEYVTRCSVGHESRRESKFYELDLNIKGISDLKQSINEFVQVEQLVEDNQYMCHICGCKRDATRCIELRTLPPVLNLQLLRFVFDRKTESKKKLTSYLQFPDTLDLSPFINSNYGSSAAGSHIYELSSVLLHKGASAHSGHYTALIKDSTTGDIYRMNDTEVFKAPDRDFARYLEEIETQDKTTTGGKKPTRLPGHTMTRTAYMLVYSRQMSTAQSSVCSQSGEVLFSDMSPSLQCEIIDDNREHEEHVNELLQRKALALGAGKNKQEDIRLMFDVIRKSADQRASGKVIVKDFEWIETKWLTEYLKIDQYEHPPIDNSSLLCSHDKLDPNKIENAKLLPLAVVEVLDKKYGIKNRLSCVSSMCRECVGNRCYVINTKQRIADEFKTIATILKNFEPNNLSGQDRSSCYWVGKLSLRRWPRLAETALSLTSDSTTDEAAEGVTAEINGVSASHESVDNSMEVELSTSRTSVAMDSTDNNPSCSSTPSMSASASRLGPSNGEKSQGDEDSTIQPSVELSATPNNNDGTDNGESELIFNDDLRCDCGFLSPDESCRRAVPVSVWDILMQYFSNTKPYQYTDPICTACQSRSEEEKKDRQDQKLKAQEQKQRLSDLYYNKNRPTLSIDGSLNDYLYIVNEEFITAWRQHLKEPMRHKLPSCINNKSCICIHDGLNYDIVPDALNVELILVTSKEWETLGSYVDCDHMIIVRRQAETPNTPPQLITMPDVCRKCSTAREDASLVDIYQFTNSTIYVCKVTDMETIIKMTSLDDAANNDNDDSYVTQPIGNKRKLKPTDGGGSGVGEGAGGGEGEGAKTDKQIRIDQAVRRSSRKQIRHDHKPFNLASTRTIDWFKLQLARAFGVYKSDQKLFFQGQELDNGDKTFADYCIPAGATLYLFADETRDDKDDKPDLIEEGFKGSALLGQSLVS